MALPWSLVVYFINMVWIVLDGWISSTVTVADVIARGIRTGDIGRSPIG